MIQVRADEENGSNPLQARHVFRCSDGLRRDVETLTCWNNSEATSKRLFVYEHQNRFETVLLIWGRTVSFESRPHRTTAQTHKELIFFCFVLFIAEFSGQLC